METYGVSLFTRDNAERNRLDLLGEVFDPLCERMLDELGVQSDARCLEVGAGSGSIAQALARRATTGEVVATDVDLSLMKDYPEQNLVRMKHDVTTDPFPAGSFDVIHARLVLSHLPQREQVLRRMAGWLKPGGFFLIESFCWFPLDSSPNPLYQKVLQRWSELICRSLGTDSHWSRNHPASFGSLPLSDLGANTVTQNLRGGTPLAEFWRLTVEMSRERLLSEALLSAEELDEFNATLSSDRFWDLAPALVQAWGRK